MVTQFAQYIPYYKQKSLIGSEPDAKTYEMSKGDAAPLVVSVHLKIGTASFNKDISKRIVKSGCTEAMMNSFIQHLWKEEMQKQSQRTWPACLKNS